MTQEEKDALSSSASIGEFLFFMALAGVAWKPAMRLLRTRQGKHLKNNPPIRKEAMENMPTRDNGDGRGEEIMADAVDDGSRADLRDLTYWDRVGREIKTLTSEALEPMSRVLKKIHPLLARVFRDHDLRISKNIKLYMDDMEPFVVGMTRAIKGMVPRKIKNKADWNAFRLALRNGDEPALRELMEKYNGEVLAYNRKKYKADDIRHREGAHASYSRMNSALKKIRTYAREDGGLPVGELENYFPSSLKDYQHFKSEMVAKRGWNEDEFNRIDEAIEAYQEKWGTPPSPAEEAEIASRILAQVERTNSGMTPGHAKTRILEKVDGGMINQYLDPADVIKGYVSKMVTATERRIFLGKANQPREVELTVDVGIGEVRDTMNLTDLGLRADLRNSIGGRLKELQDEMGFKITNDEIERVTNIINARFNAKGHGQLIGDFKNITYISLLGNFGAAITQLGDLAYSIHFNGLGNTYRAIFDGGKDWYRHMGLDSSDIDLASSRGGLAKVLNGVLTATQFNRLDKFGKNTVMKSTFIRMSREAKSNPSKLLNELEPIYGKEVANKIRNDLVSGDMSPDVESVIWYKFLDLQPAALSEMPLKYAEGGANRLMYTLKTFTIKQWDVFREAGFAKIAKSYELWNQGDKSGAVALGKEGLAGVASLAAIFAAMNAGTSVIKDTMHGRSTDYDELSVDMMFRLIGGNRFLAHQARREGVGKAAMNFIMPATTAIDRASKDLISLTAGEAPVEVYRGIGVGDFYYWHYGGGREKTRKEIAKQYGLKLEYVPK